MGRYRVLTALTYEVKGRRRRVEPGDIVSDLPARSVSWLVEQGHVEQIKDGE